MSNGTEAEDLSAGPSPARSAWREPDIAVGGLTKSYQRDAPVLAGVDLTIRRGQAVALIGANGSGKSTLLRCCLRLIEPDAGSIRVLGEEVAGLPRRGLRRVRARVGFVFQRHNLVPRLSVLTNVVHGAQARHAGPRVWFHALAAREVREEAMACLQSVGLAHLAGRRADQLSGGQSQRVAIARALMQRPELMMADEPVASLDPNAGEEVMELFVELIRNQNLTLFFTSHNLEHAARYAERILGLRGGCVQLDARSATVNIDALRGIYE
jgi:phosphonate transport system ATP-binding protein